MNRIEIEKVLNENRALAARPQRWDRGKGKTPSAKR